MGVCGAGQGSGWPRLLRSPAGLAGDPRSRYLWIEACTLNKAFLPQMYTHPTSAIPDCPFLCATPRCFPAVLVSQAVLWRAEGSCRGGNRPSLVQKKRMYWDKTNFWSELDRGTGSDKAHPPLQNHSVGAAVPGEADVITSSLLIAVCGFLWRIPSARAGSPLQMSVCSIGLAPGA